MARNSIPIISLLLLLTCSCCKDSRRQNGIQPLWEMVIPTGSSEAIFYDGLRTLPMYKDWLIAHTTIADEGIFQEDNRLCAVNIQTKQVDWYFPGNLDQRVHCAFRGQGYLYKNKLVFRYVKDFIEASKSNRTTLCLNLDTQDIIWETTEDREFTRTGWSYGNGAHVVGNGSECYFIQNENELYRVNLETDSYVKIYDAGEEFIHDFSLLKDSHYLMLFCYESVQNGEEDAFRNIIRIMDVSSLQFIYTRQVVPSAESDSNHFMATGIESDGILYVDIDCYLTAIDWKQDVQLWEREDYWAYTKMDMSVFDNTLMKCGGNATVGYDIHTGDIIYDYRNHGSQYTTFDGPYAYMVTAGAKLEIIERASGIILETITSPGNNQANGGFYGSYPCIYGDKMYIMGDSNKLYCYPKYPW